MHIQFIQNVLQCNDDHYYLLYVHLLIFNAFRCRRIHKVWYFEICCFNFIGSTQTQCQNRTERIYRLNGILTNELERRKHPLTGSSLQIERHLLLPSFQVLNVILTVFIINNNNVLITPHRATELYEKRVLHKVSL